jgi:transposase InsO family protein
LLRREGEPSGINRIYRLYREAGLTVRKRKARRKAIGTRAPIRIEARADARWSLDFVHDQFACGRRFRVLNVVDDVTRECLAAIPDTSISGRRVARELTALIERRGKPGMIVSDNVLAREQYAVQGVRSCGIRATGYPLNSCPGGLRRQELVSSMTLLMAWMPPPDGIAMCQCDEC